jgi:hypothetical protein
MQLSHGRMGGDNDLSEYERVRLENIKRNAAFLSGIGIQEQTKLISASKPTSAPVVDKKVGSKRKRAPVAEEQPRRYSLRVRDIKPDYKEVKVSDISKKSASAPTGSGFVDSAEEEGGIDYDSIPREPHRLDDFEFEIYVQLKKWRLLKSREMELEAYKIFHNDTFCDMIRRKRNDPSWGVATGDDGVLRTEEQRSRQLQECYGVGPSKSRVEPKGLALECLELIELADNIEKLEQSRKLSA